MNIDDFQIRVSQQYTPSEDMDTKEMVINNVLGLVGEAGEVADVAKKVYYIGRKDVGIEDYIEEMGDVLWHLACLANVLGVELSECLDYNQSKLAFRYGEGCGPRS